MPKNDLKSSPYNSGQIAGLGNIIEKIDREQRRRRLVLAKYPDFRNNYLTGMGGSN